MNTLLFSSSFLLKSLQTHPFLNSTQNTISIHTCASYPESYRLFILILALSPVSKKRTWEIEVFHIVLLLHLYILYLFLIRSYNSGNPLCIYSIFCFFKFTLIFSPYYHTQFTCTSSFKILSHNSSNEYGIFDSFSFSFIFDSIAL